DQLFVSSQKYGVQALLFFNLTPLVAVRRDVVDIIRRGRR
ncbi:MAG: hypothetical protein QOG73_2478, partial [Acetobacteraceae bacterium]|nr:hypothetical protein [Acetobacteraceae bacterium]